jgi:REP-associated tyrosine transposase
VPRKARIILPNTPHHIVQRGHHRKAVFIEASDYQIYLDTMQEWKEALGVAVYAWCLMTNHVHIILNPGSDPTSIGLLMKRLAARQTRHVNKFENRTGSLWEGRYKASPI